MSASAWFALAAVGLWFGVHWAYVLAMAARAALERGELTVYWWVMLVLPALVGVVLDFAFNITFGWLMFLETPTGRGWLFSHRVQHHFLHSTGWRGDLAEFWARNLNVFDPRHIRR